LTGPFTSEERLQFYLCYSGPFLANCWGLEVRARCYADELRPRWTAAPQMDNLQLQPIVVWRQGVWHCEYLKRGETRGGTLCLYRGSTLAISRKVRSVDEMQWIAHEWKQVVSATPITSGKDSSAQDQRVRPPERRAVPRGGRREGDPKR
jgi:hypothetical protein